MSRWLAVLGVGGASLAGVLAVIALGSSATADHVRADKPHGQADKAHRYFRGYNRPLVGARGRFVKADGSFADSCIQQTRHNGGCDQPLVPLYRPRPALAVRGGTRVSIQFFHRKGDLDRPRKVSATLSQVSAKPPPGNVIKRGSAKLDAHPTAGHRHWSFRLPHNLRGGNVLNVHTRLPGFRGHGNYWVGLKP